MRTVVLYTVCSGISCSLIRPHKYTQNSPLSFSPLKSFNATQPFFTDAVLPLWLCLLIQMLRERERELSRRTCIKAGNSFALSCPAYLHFHSACVLSSSCEKNSHSICVSFYFSSISCFFFFSCCSCQASISLSLSFTLVITTA